MPPAARRARLRALLAARDLDALLVTDLVNIRYLTGFSGSNAALLVHAGGDVASLFGTDFRYVAQAGTEVPDLEHLVDRATATAVAATAAGRGAARLGFESDAVTVEAHLTLADAAAPAALHRAPGLVAGLRAVKDDDEVAALRAACAAADAALAGLLACGGVRPGRTEREVALDLEIRMREAGATGPAFASIVAAGAHSAVPHHRPTDAVLRRGDLVKMDFGALVAGYHSDLTRTVVLGPAADWQREVHAVVAAGQAAGRVAAVPGADLVAVDAAARDVIAGAGYGAQFGHGLGHGVGLEIHEAPMIGPKASGALASGMVVTVEPGVYLPGRGGVRVEDTVVVAAGGDHALTAAPRDLLEV